PFWLAALGDMRVIPLTGVAAAFAAHGGAKLLPAPSAWGSSRGSATGGRRRRGWPRCWRRPTNGRRETGSGCDERGISGAGAGVRDGVRRGRRHGAGPARREPGRLHGGQVPPARPGGRGG